MDGSADISQRAVDLLAHERELRTLVRALLRGDDRASEDDVVQETWLRALRRPPQSSGSVVAFLRQVARRVVIDRHRADRARSRREREVAAAAPASGEQSPAEVVERLQACAAVSQAVAELPVGLRDAVVLRYLQGQSVDDVAKRLGISPAAARQRVHRGIVALRGHLDGALGEEAAANGEKAAGGWRSAPAWLAVAGLPQGTETVPSLSLLAITAMSKTGSFLAVAALLLLGAVLWFGFGDSLLWQPGAVAESAGAARPTIQQVESGAGSPRARRAVALGDETAGDASAAPTAAVDLGLRVRVQVVDSESGQPVARAPVAVMHRSFDWYGLDAAAKARIRAVGQDQHSMLQAFGEMREADDEGYLDLPIERELFVSSVAEGRSGDLIVYANQLIEGQTLQLPLQPDFGFEVRVVESGSRQPVEAIPVVLLPRWSDPALSGLQRRAFEREAPVANGVTDERGRLSVPRLRRSIRAWTDTYGVRPDGIAIAAEIAGHDVLATARSVQLDALPATPIELVVPAARGTVMVRCVGPDSAPRGDGEDVRLARPVPNVVWSSSVPLGAGRARFDHVASEGEFVARYSEPMTGDTHEITFPAPAAGTTREVTLQIPAAPVSVVGRFVDEAGEPLPHTRVWLLDPGSNAWHRRQLLTHGDARFRLELDEAVVGQEFRSVRLLERKRYVSGARLGTLRDLGELTLGKHDLGDVTLAVMPRLATVHVTVDGRTPQLLPSLRVEAFDTKTGSGWLRRRVGDPIHVVARSAGRFDILGCDDGRPMRAHVEANDCLPHPPVALDSRGGSHEVRLRRGATLELDVQLPTALRSDLTARLVGDDGAPWIPSDHGALGERVRRYWRGLPFGAYRLEVQLLGNSQTVHVQRLEFGAGEFAPHSVAVDLRSRLREIAVEVALPDGSSLADIVPGAQAPAAVRIGSPRLAEGDELVGVVGGQARLWCAAGDSGQTVVAFVPGYEPAVGALPPPGVDRVRLLLRPRPAMSVRLPVALQGRTGLVAEVRRATAPGPYLTVDRNQIALEHMLVPRRVESPFDARGVAEFAVVAEERLVVTVVDSSGRALGTEAETLIAAPRTTFELGTRR